MRQAPARHPPGPPPGWARRFVAAYLAVFLVCGLAGFEAWPLTGWRLFADARPARQPGFQAVTVEDLLEELVGEIYDEFDADSRGIQPQPDGSLVLPGSFPLHDLPDLGISLPEGRYTTVAGLVLDRLGRLPDKGETVQIDGWQLDVLAVERHAITRLRLTPINDDANPPADRRTELE